jgi:hypothetical protein
VKSHFWALLSQENCISYAKIDAISTQKNINLSAKFLIIIPALKLLLKYSI